MRFASRTLTIAVVVMLSVVGSSRAAVDVFLCADADDILGDSADGDHAGCSDAISVAQRVVLDATAGGAVDCRESFKPLTVAKRIDGASAGYLLAALQQKRLRGIEIFVRKAAGETRFDFLQLTLVSAVVVGVEQDIADADDPVERISFLPSAIRWSFTPTQSNGAPGTPIKARLNCAR